MTHCNLATFTRWMVNYCQASDWLLLLKFYTRYLRVTEGSASVTIRLSSFPKSEILNDMDTVFGNSVCSLKDASSLGWPFWKLWRNFGSRIVIYFIYFICLDYYFVILTLVRCPGLKKSVCARKPTLVVTDNDNSDCDTVDKLASAELPESETVEKN